MRLTYKIFPEGKGFKPKKPSAQVEAGKKLSKKNMSKFNQKLFQLEMVQCVAL